MKYVSLIGLLLLFGLQSCEKKTTEPEAAAVAGAVAGPEIVITDLQAGKSSNGAPSGDIEIFYFNLGTGKAGDANNWDIAFTGIYNTQIIINTKANTWASILNTDYTQIVQPPSVPYQTAQSGSIGDSAEGWYAYDMQTHVLETIPGKTICIKTGAGSIYKLEMKSIYEGAPKHPTPQDRAPYLNFRYQKLK